MSTSPLCQRPEPLKRKEISSYQGTDIQLKIINMENQTQLLINNNFKLEGFRHLGSAKLLHFFYWEPVSAFPWRSTGYNALLICYLSYISITNTYNHLDHELYLSEYFVYKWINAVISSCSLDLSRMSTIAYLFWKLRLCPF